MIFDHLTYWQILSTKSFFRFNAIITLIILGLANLLK